MFKDSFCGSARVLRKLKNSFCGRATPWFFGRERVICTSSPERRPEGSRGLQAPESKPNSKKGFSPGPLFKCLQITPFGVQRTLAREGNSSSICCVYGTIAQATRHPRIFDNPTRIKPHK